MYNLETQSLNFMGSHVEYLKVRSWALFYFKNIMCKAQNINYLS